MLLNSQQLVFSNKKNESRKVEYDPLIKNGYIN